MWQEKFHGDLGVAWEKKQFACPSENSHVAKAFYHTYAPSFRPNSTGFRPEFYPWASAIIKRTIFNKRCDAVAQMVRSSGTMEICPSFFDSSEIWTSGTIVHEATHGLAFDPGHVDCQHGIHKGKRACDRRLYERFRGSGHNYQFMFLWWVKNNSDYHLLRRATIQSTLRWMVLNVFNEVTEAQRQKWLGSSRD